MHRIIEQADIYCGMVKTPNPSSHRKGSRPDAESGLHRDGPGAILGTPRPSQTGSMSVPHVASSSTGTPTLLSTSNVGPGWSELTPAQRLPLWMRNLIGKQPR
jgi:hypothetical protein